MERIKVEIFPDPVGAVMWKDFLCIRLYRLCGVISCQYGQGILNVETFSDPMFHNTWRVFLWVVSER